MMRSRTMICLGLASLGCLLVLGVVLPAVASAQVICQPGFRDRSDVSSDPRIGWTLGPAFSVRDRSWEIDDVEIDGLCRNSSIGSLPDSERYPETSGTSVVGLQLVAPGEYVSTMFGLGLGSYEDPEGRSFDELWQFSVAVSWTAYRFDLHDYFKPYFGVGFGLTINIAEHEDDTSATSMKDYFGELPLLLYLGAEIIDDLSITIFPTYTIRAYARIGTDNETSFSLGTGDREIVYREQEPFGFGVQAQYRWQMVSAQVETRFGEDFSIAFQIAFVWPPK